MIEKMNVIDFDTVKDILECDPDLPSGLRWKSGIKNNVRAGLMAGGIDKEGYWQIMIKKRPYRAHRLVWLIKTGKLPNGYIDHIDGNPSNNHIKNLRECCDHENQQNRRLSKNNKSGMTGVVWNKNCKKWQAQIKILGRTIYLGLFDNLEEASLARALAKSKFHTFNPVSR